MSGGSTSKLMDTAFIDFVQNIVGVDQVSPTVTSSKQFIYGTYNTNTNIV